MPLTRRRFTVDEYHRMGDTGILHEDDRVELLEGEIVVMSPIGSRHAAAVRRLEHAFHALVGRRAVVSVQNPIVLGRYWEPHPDVCLLEPRDDFYAGAHPRSEDVLLVVEVGDTSAQGDRDQKLPQYAQAGIPEVWLVSLPTDTIEFFRNPQAGRYTVLRTATRGETLTPLLLPAITLRVDEILG